jgi:hypothetical protein
MKILGIFLLLFAAHAASAQTSSALLGRKLISVGEDTDKARDAGGDPDKLDKIPGDATTPPMEIWTYQRKGREITLWIVNDKIVQVDDKKMEDKKD